MGKWSPSKEMMMMGCLRLVVAMQHSSDVWYGRCSELCDVVDTTSNEERRQSSKAAAKKQSLKNDKAKKPKRK